MAMPAALVALAAIAPLPAEAQGFTEDFRVQDCTWKHRGGQNGCFPLRPGQQSIIVGEDEDGALIRVEINTLNEKERIRFAAPNGDNVALMARVWEEREFE